eukprot:7250600-Prymnesium_polylepis.1
MACSECGFFRLRTKGAARECQPVQRPARAASLNYSHIFRVVVTRGSWDASFAILTDKMSLTGATRGAPPLAATTLRDLSTGARHRKGFVTRAVRRDLELSSAEVSTKPDPDGRL